VITEQANLGLATTAELLHELEARGWTWPEDEARGSALDMARAARHMTAQLPDEVLAYRTVDS
jgi:hypothetical protein